MPNSETQHVPGLTALIADFLKKRLDVKLEKIKGDEEKDIVARQKERDRFEKTNWLSSAAKRARQIQVVTHVLKATHPDIKINEGTNLYVLPRSLAPRKFLGSHVLDEVFEDDATGNSAALDVYDFLTQRYGANTILALARKNDPDLGMALSDNQDLAWSWMQTFSEVVESPCLKPQSHTLAKQLYWFIGDNLDPHDDRNFHLIAPLYASSLAHRVYLIIQNDRFSEEAKAARQARETLIYS